MKTYSIRKAEKGDASRLAEIQIFSKRTAYRPVFQNDIVSFNEMQVLDLALFYRDAPGALDDIYVFDDGIVKGMMHWGSEETAHGLFELKELYIDPFFQGEGIGSELMKNFLSHAKDLSMKAVFLWVLEENNRARKFYENKGYRYDGMRKLFPGTDKFLLRYTKVLKNTDC